MSIRANRPFLLHGELLDSAIGWAVSQLVTSTTIDRDHGVFLDSVGVKRHKVGSWSQVTSAMFPFDPASILFIPAEVEWTQD
jgi:hypothetical protein